MGRDPRVQAADTIQHVTARGDGGEPVFLAPDDRRAFLARLGEEVVESSWTLLSYCLMSNHVHLLIELGDKGISTGMHRVLTGHSHRFNARHQREGHVFGNRFHARVIEDEEHLPAAFRYVAWNPCKAGLATTPEQWPWSAHRAQRLGRLPRDDARCSRGARRHPRRP